jgi:hypothetical protein
MEQLPAEIVLNIFALATADDIKTAFNLCLVSSATQRIVTALLYKHVVITGTDQVRRFNASFKLLPPRTLKLIRGMTLLDKKLAIVERDYREEKLDREAQCKGGWIKQWKDLIRYIGHLSRRYRLDALAYMKRSRHASSTRIINTRSHLQSSSQKTTYESSTWSFLMPTWTSFFPRFIQRS